MDLGLSGDLRSQNVATGTTIDDILSKESTGIQFMYSLSKSTKLLQTKR